MPSLKTVLAAWRAADRRTPLQRLGDDMSMRVMMIRAVEGEDDPVFDGVGWALYGHMVEALSCLRARGHAIPALTPVPSHASAYVAGLLFLDWCMSAEGVPYESPARTLRRLRSGASPDGEHLRPLTPAQQEVWQALCGKCLQATALARSLDRLMSPEAARKRIQSIRRAGFKILQIRGLGYYRPDAPPTEWN